MKTFIQLVREAKYTPEDIDDWISAWHESDSERELHDTLGMTFDQYTRWVDGEDIAQILLEHHIVVVSNDIRLPGLKIQHGIGANQQETDFMNACLSESEGTAISIAATPPKAYFNLSRTEFNNAIKKDLAMLGVAGWTFEIQQGANFDGQERRKQEMIATINAQG